MAQNQQLGTLGQVLTVNTAANTVTVNSQISVGNTSMHSTGITVGNTSLHSNGITIDGTAINTTSFAGTANNTLYVGSVIAANVVSNAQLQANVTTIQGQITSNASAAYTNATVFASNASNINTGTLAEARLPYRMDQNVRTTDTITLGNLTLTGNLYVGSNVNIIGANNLSVVDNMIYLNANNTVANPDLGFAGNYNDGIYHHAGFFRDASDSGTWKVFDNYLPEPDANAYIDTTNTSFHLANFQANTLNAGNTSTNWFIANTSGTYTTGTVNAVSYYAGSTLIGNTTGPYGKTESALNVNSALTSNNSTNLGGTSAASYRLVSSGQVIPSGTVMVFQQTAAPTGFTKVTTYNDYAMRIVSGSVSTGGSVAFSTAFTSQSVSGTVGSTTAAGTVGDTTLSTSQIPSHTHSYYNNGSAYDNPYNLSGTRYNVYASAETGATGGGGSHNHTFTGTAHNHTFTGTAINMAVNYVDFILASAN